MHQHRFTFACLATCVLIYATVSAAEKTMTAKVKAVDAAKNSITLDDLTLDVTRKTKITVDGKKSKLEDIKTGQQAKVTYDDGLEVATSISVSKNGEGDDEATAKAMKALQGEWKCVAMEEIGKTLDKKAVKEQDRRVTIKGNSYNMMRTQNGMRGGHVGKFEIDASNGYFEFIGKGGEEWIGIYELNGDTFKVCYRYKRNDDCVRPTEFKTDKDQPSISVFYTFKRDKDE